jgi:protein-L-isoaspartate(D-aspartate) O-methyltransferase
LKAGRHTGVVATNADLLEALGQAGIRDRRVLDAIRRVPRHEFVPHDWRRHAYEDVPLPIPRGQVTTQPSLLARMIEALDLRGQEKVLEIGTGYGFQTALLSMLAREVWSVERWPELADAGRTNLARRGINNAHVVLGDGTAGLPGQAAFEAIVVAAAFTSVPEPLVEQLAVGGRLVQPIGPGGREDVTLFVKSQERLRPTAVLTGANFVPLVGAHAFVEE